MWLRKYVREKTGPIPTDLARTWKFNFSFIYSVVAWNVLGLAAYLFINSNMPKNHGSMYQIHYNFFYLDKKFIIYIIYSQTLTI